MEGDDTSPTGHLQLKTQKNEQPSMFSYSVWLSGHSFLFCESPFLKAWWGFPLEAESD